MPQENKITDEQRKKYREIDWFWGTQMPCGICGKCSCETCHPNGPCKPPNEIHKHSNPPRKQEEELHECTCGAKFSDFEDLRAHQHNVHDPDDIMFSEFGELK